MQGMNLIVRTVARMAAGFFAALGMLLVLYGHLEPGAGGGLAGGALVAASLLLMLLAFGRGGAGAAGGAGGERMAARLHCVGALHVLLVGLAALGGGAFFYNLMDKGEQFHVMSSGTIVWLNIGMGLAVAAGVYAAVSALLGEGADGGDAHEEDGD